MPTDQLTIDAGYSLTIAKLREYAYTEYAANTQAGNYLQHAPKHMAYGWAFYDFAGKLKGLKLGAGFNYTSKVYVNAANTMTFDPYAVCNAMMSYSFKQWRLQLNVNNIFDKTYYMYAVSTTGYVPEEGRNVRFSATFNL
jgi:outer membrane receptor protein involved in Fe transport